MAHTYLRIFKSIPQHFAQIGAVAMALAVVFALAMAAAPAAQAQTFQVIHAFTGGVDGGNPEAGLTVDAAGNFYGTTEFGNQSAGTVFKLVHSRSGWVLTTLYSFHGGYDGSSPWGRVAIASDGTLYGTTTGGGGGNCQPLGCGTVFQLTPPPTALAQWNETQIYAFGGVDGDFPTDDLTFDPSGHIYGTTYAGGWENLGTVYELTPSWGTWTETVLYSAYYSDTGVFPRGGVVLDKSGNLYGVMTGGNNPQDCWPTVYELSPTGSGWTPQILVCFITDASNIIWEAGTPEAGLIIDQSGNLYGTAAAAFELTPANGTWTFNYFAPLSGASGAKLVVDSTGNFYGTTWNGGAYGDGNVFKLTLSNGAWTYTSLYDFTGGTDGSNPVSNVVFDAQGKLYGTTLFGGSYRCTGSGCGVVWEITP